MTQNDHFSEKHYANKAMDKKTKIAIGMMSGTSADGVDASIISTNGEKIYDFGEFVTIKYTADESKKIKSAYQIDERRASKQETSLLKEVSSLITLKHIEAVKTLLKKSNLTHKDIDIIGFHGQTIVHKPDENYTLQIGDGQKLANETQIDVVADFRTNDVKNGGQGAPLIPVYHNALTIDEPRPLAIINIGGVANITYLGAKKDELMGFDTGTGNAMINDWVNLHANKDFDDRGNIAKSGKVDTDILKKLFNHPYFEKKPPKSLDRNDFIKKLSPLINNLNLEDGAATLTEFTALGIKKSLKFLPKEPKKIIIVGGGAYNDFLIKRIKELCNIEVTIPNQEQKGWNVERIEADGFALMAVRRLYNLPISWAKTTGVNLPSCIGGKIFKA
jgi:anhydro-N-acetylmuramic acid kinase